MIRFSSLVLCTALITLPAFAAEGPQEQALDQAIAQVQGQNATAAPAATAPAETSPSPTATKKGHHKKHKAATTKTAAPGPDERRMDEGQQPDNKPDPQDAEIRKLNGGN